MTAAATKTKPRTAKPFPSAFIADEPCAVCGCEWAGTTIDLTQDGDEAFGVGCANPYHHAIATYRANIKALRSVASLCWNRLDEDVCKAIATETGAKESTLPATIAAVFAEQNAPVPA